MQSANTLFMYWQIVFYETRFLFLSPLRTRCFAELLNSVKNFGL